MKKISLRLRLTLISMGLLLLCCLGLTIALNHSAGNMADTIEAITVLPAATVGEETHESAATIPLVPAASAQQARVLFTRQSYLYMLLVVIAGGVLTWFITGRALRPLGELSEEMRRRTVQDLSESLPVPESHDEIASLTCSFNEMSLKLDDAFSVQKRFAQSAAHELRTPLTVLKAKVDVFGKRPVHTQEEYEKLLELVGRQTDRMTELVNDLLGLTNLDDLACDQRVELKSLLDEAVQELTPLAAERNILLNVNAENVCVTGNYSLLYRVFANLIENGIKYNFAGGTVSVSTASDGDTVSVCVSDTGPGIPDEHKKLIFEPFYRVDKSRSRQMGGAGLGLATVKAIVGKHGGTIQVSDAPGGGSAFTICL